MDFDYSTNEVHEMSAGEEYPSIEEELTWLKADQKLNE
jgi:tryptophan synthase beta subunit